MTVKWLVVELQKLLQQTGAVPDPMPLDEGIGTELPDARHPLGLLERPFREPLEPWRTSADESCRTFSCGDGF